MLLCLLLGAAAASACSSSADVDRKTEMTLAEHEATFDPARYRVEKPISSTPLLADADTAVTLQDTGTEDSVAVVEWVERDQSVMGFRLQLYSTTSLDEAERKRDELAAKLLEFEQDAESISLVFDAPYYKIRYGNYLNRNDADLQRSVLQKIGLTDAWVVRDKVTSKVRVKKK